MRISARQNPQRHAMNVGVAGIGGARKGSRRLPVARFLRRGSALLTAGLVVAACSGAAEEPTTTKNAGAFVQALESEPESLDPARWPAAEPPLSRPRDRPGGLPVRQGRLGRGGQGVRRPDPAVGQRSPPGHGSNAAGTNLGDDQLLPFWPWRLAPWSLGGLFERLPGLKGLLLPGRRRVPLPAGALGPRLP
jgi:hypothetical protein